MRIGNATPEEHPALADFIIALEQKVTALQADLEKTKLEWNSVDLEWQARQREVDLLHNRRLALEHAVKRGIGNSFSVATDAQTYLDFLNGQPQ